jgi:hypothetical protein
MGVVVLGPGVDSIQSKLGDERAVVADELVRAHTLAIIGSAFVTDANEVAYALSQFGLDPQEVLVEPKRKHFPSLADAVEEWFDKYALDGVVIKTIGNTGQNQEVRNQSRNRRIARLASHLLLVIARDSTFMPEWVDAIICAKTIGNKVYIYRSTM